MANSPMADDRYPRVPRPGEAFRRETPPADQKGDPLAELARLIGSTDPFADPPRHKQAPPSPRVADPSSWDDAPQEAPRSARHEPPHDFKFRPDDADADEPPRAVRHVPGFDDDDTEPEALDTWRPNDPYHHTEGMFPREPQVFAEPTHEEPRRDPPPAPGYTSRDTSFAQRGWTPPRPSVAPSAFDPDDPLGFERDARAQEHARAEHARAEHAKPPAPGYGPVHAPAMRYDDPGAGGHYAAAPRPAAGYGQGRDHGDQRDHGRDLADLARGFHEPFTGIPDAPRGTSQWPAEAPDARALHPDAYLRQRSDAYTGGGGGADPGAHLGDRRADLGDVDADLDDRYSTEDLAAHYAGAAAARPAPSKRPKAVIIAAAVFALCFIGAAGAFGYRLVFSGPSKPAPVIRADGAPNKVVPAASGDTGKQIQDRLADKGAGEKIVSREEQPVEIRDASRPPTPRMVFPNQTAGAAQVPTTTVQPPPAPAPFASAAAPATGGQEPKRIRTVTIKSDQNAPQGAQAPARAPAPPPPPPAAARGDSTAPLSLSPAAPPARTAAAPPAPPPAAPTLAAASSGGYVVQVSAQKSETEAETTFRSLQHRYPNQLGGRQPIIRRKDTASGTMYGAQVGPFASRDEAVQLCEGLKSAGGSCFVQRN